MVSFFGVLFYAVQKIKIICRLTDVLGYPACSLLGESFFTLIHTADIQKVQAAFSKREYSVKDSCDCFKLS